MKQVMMKNNIVIMRIYNADSTEKISQKRMTSSLYTYIFIFNFFHQYQTQITKVHENGAYVTLLEYQDIEGLILSTEVTRKRVKTVNKFLKMGKQETMMVIRVDKEKRYIDLSKKKVQPEEAAEAEKFFKKAKMVHNIMRQVAVKLNCTLLSLYEQFGWDLYDKYEHAYDAFRIIMKYGIIYFVKRIVTQSQSSRTSKLLKSKRKFSLKVLPRKWLLPQSN